MAQALRRRGLERDRGPGRCEGRILAGTDGGSDGRGLRRVAGWGVAVAGSDGEATGTARGVVPGLDQSSWMAELVALVVLLAAAAQEAVDLHVIIDNASVQNGFSLIWQGFRVLPEFGFGL